MDTTVEQAILQSGLDLIDARALLRHVLGIDDAWLIAHSRDELTFDQIEKFAMLIVRRREGEPVAHLTGTREFFGLEFTVTPAVLIPRPETELLVEWVLERFAQNAEGLVLDLGTGSGCIAISIALARPRMQVVALDSRHAALDVARANLRRHGVDNVRLGKSDWFAAVAGDRFDVIVSNPPYIAVDDPHLALGDLRFEPAGSLTSGVDGLDAVRTIVAAAPRYLRPGGCFVCEHGYDQAPRCRKLLEDAGFAQVFSRSDLAGIERISGGRLDVKPRPG